MPRSLSGYLGHVAAGHMDVWLTVLTVAAVLLGSQFGASFMTTKAKPQWVKQLYAVVLVGIAVKLLVGVL